MVVDDLPLIPAIEALMNEARKTAAVYAGYGFTKAALAWSFKADAYADCLWLAEKQHRAYSDASTARPAQKEAVPALHTGTAGNAAAVQPQNEG